MLNHWARVAVSVVCDGSRLNEYEITALDDKTAACYIPSEAGKSFSIVYENRLSYGLLVCIRFDGALVGSFYSAPGADSIVNGAQISSALERPFIFSRGGPEKIEYPNRIHSGTIQVDFYRYAAVWECETSSSAEMNAVNPIPDASKGAGMHHIRLGDAITSKPRPQIQGHVLDPMDNPYARFMFHYCPREILRRSRVLALPRPLRCDIAESPMTDVTMRTASATPTRGSLSMFGSGDQSADADGLQDRPVHLLKSVHNSD